MTAGCMGTKIEHRRLRINRRTMRILDYPYVIVRLDCRRCHRQGRYRLARLAAALGPEAPVEAIVKRLTLDCPYRTGADRLRPKADDGCHAKLIDLEGFPRPPDLPPALGALRVVKGGR